MRDKFNTDPKDDPAYEAIRNRLQEAWREYDGTAQCIKISTNIFRIRDETSHLSHVAEGMAMSALEMVKI